jgi:hypothetical protein
VPLSGQYEFFWTAHHDSSDAAIAATRGEHSYIQVPATWNGHDHHGTTVGSDGYATYRLNVLVADQGPLTLLLPEQGTAYRVLVDGTWIAESGFPGFSEDRTTPSNVRHLVNIIPRGQRLEIIFQVSNFHHRMGGLSLPIEIGHLIDPRTQRAFRLSQELLLFGSIMVLGIYHLILFAFRHESRSTLYFGAFCLLLAVHTLLVGERFATVVVPGLSYELLIKFEYLCWYLAPSAFIAYLRKVFPHEFHCYIERSILGIFMVLSLIVLVTPVAVFSHTATVAQVVTIVALLVGAGGLAVAVRHRREGAMFLLAAYIIMFAAIINDMGVVNMCGARPYWPQSGCLFLSCCKARCWHFALIRRPDSWNCSGKCSLPRTYSCAYRKSFVRMPSRCKCRCKVGSSVARRWRRSGYLRGASRTI